MLELMLLLECSLHDRKTRKNVCYCHTRSILKVSLSKVLTRLNLQDGPKSVFIIRLRPPNPAKILKTMEVVYSLLILSALPLRAP